MRSEQALDKLLLAISSNPTLPVLHQALGQTLQRTNNNMAVLAFRTAVDYGSMSEECWKCLLHVCESESNWRLLETLSLRATELFQRFRNLYFVRRPSPWCGLAVARVQLGGISGVFQIVTACPHIVLENTLDAIIVIARLGEPPNWADIVALCELAIQRSDCDQQLWLKLAEARAVFRDLDGAVEALERHLEAMKKRDEELSGAMGKRHVSNMYVYIARPFWPDPWEEAHQFDNQIDEVWCRRVYKDCLNRYPNDPGAWCNLMEQYTELDDVAEFVDDIMEAFLRVENPMATFQPLSARVDYEYNVARAAGSCYLALCHIIIRFYDEEPWAWEGLARACAGHNDVPGAIAALRKALQIHPHDHCHHNRNTSFKPDSCPANHFNLVASAFRWEAKPRNWDGYRAIYELAVEIHPEESWSWRGLMRVPCDNGDATRVALQRFFALNPDVHNMYHSGVEREFLDEPGNRLGYQYFQELASERCPEDYRGWEGLAHVRAIQGDIAGAIRLFTHASLICEQGNPGRELYFERVCDSLYQESPPNVLGARKVCEAATKLHPKESWSWEYFAKACAACGEVESVAAALAYGLGRSTRYSSYNRQGNCQALQLAFLAGSYLATPWNWTGIKYCSERLLEASSREANPRPSEQTWAFWLFAACANLGDHSGAIEHWRRGASVRRYKCIWDTLRQAFEDTMTRCQSSEWEFKDTALKLKLREQCLNVWYALRGTYEDILDQLDWQGEYERSWVVYARMQEYVVQQSRYGVKLLDNDSLY